MQYGGPDGELSAAMRYLTQRYTMPTGMTGGLLTDIGTEELAHLEIIATMVYKLLDGATIEQIKAAGLDLQYAVREPHRRAMDRGIHPVPGRPNCGRSRRHGRGTEGARRRRRPHESGMFDSYGNERSFAARNDVRSPRK